MNRWLARRLRRWVDPGRCLCGHAHIHECQLCKQSSFGVHPLTTVTGSSMAITEGGWIDVEGVRRTHLPLDNAPEACDDTDTAHP